MWRTSPSASLEKEYTSLLLPYPSPHTQHLNFANSTNCGTMETSAGTRPPPWAQRWGLLAPRGSSGLSMASSGQGGQASGPEDKWVTNLSKVKSFTFGNYLLFLKAVCSFFSGLKKQRKKKKVPHNRWIPLSTLSSKVTVFVFVIFPTLYGKMNYVNSYILNTVIQV